MKAKCPDQSERPSPTPLSLLRAKGMRFKYQSEFLTSTLKDLFHDNPHFVTSLTEASSKRILSAFIFRHPCQLFGTQIHPADVSPGQDDRVLSA